MDNNSLSCAAVVTELKKLDPERTTKLTVSTVWRHANGKVSPPDWMKSLYLQLTGAAVTPSDWFALSQNPELGRKAEKSEAA
jgi:hypothetical protein